MQLPRVMGTWPNCPPIYRRKSWKPLIFKVAQKTGKSWQIGWKMWVLVWQLRTEKPTASNYFWALMLFMVISMVLAMYYSPIILDSPAPIIPIILPILDSGPRKAWKSQASTMHLLPLLLSHIILNGVASTKPWENRMTLSNLMPVPSSKACKISLTTKLMEFLEPLSISSVMGQHITEQMKAQQRSFPSPNTSITTLKDTKVQWAKM